MRFGFGLERIGLAALARPRLFGFFLVLVTAIAGWHVPRVDFNGSLMSILPDSSKTYLEYQEQKEEFRDFSRDVAVILKSPRLFTASGLEDLRSIQLELALVDGVSGTASLFSIPDPDPQTGELGEFFPPYLEDDEQALSLLSRLLERFPAASNLVAMEEQSALIVVALDLGEDDARNARAYGSLREIKSAVSGIAPADFEIKYAGLTPIGLTILDTLVRDQVRLTVLGLVLGALVAIVLFRNLSAALVCAIPPALTAIWSVGLLSMMGISINYLTTVLPTLALVLAYADGIVLYHCWNRENAGHAAADSERMIENLSFAVRRIGPATALTSITTAVAIASFTISPNTAMVEFGWLGVVFITFAFFAVITALPVSAFLVVKLRWAKPGKSHIPEFPFLTRFAIAAGRHAYLVAGIAIIAAALMFLLHNLLQAEYRVTDYLPTKSETLTAETVANEIFGGAVNPLGNNHPLQPVEASGQ